MNASDAVFFDTNILVYAHDASAPAKREKAQSLILDAFRQGGGVISAQVLSEFFVTVTRKIAPPLPVNAARQEVRVLSRLRVVDTDATLVIRAIDIRDKSQIGFWDALILAAAERAGCKTVWSEDLSDGQIYGKLCVRNPFKAV